MSTYIENHVEASVFDSLNHAISLTLADALEDVITDEAVKAAVEEKVTAAVDTAVKKITEDKHTHFSNVYEFVDNLIAPLYPFPRSREREVRWARRWWAHPEAVARLYGLWMRFEQLKAAEPATYLETFLRVHADYHMRQLMIEGGVFDACRRQDEPSIPLPTDPLRKEEHQV